MSGPRLAADSKVRFVRVRHVGVLLKVIRATYLTVGYRSSQSC